MPMKESQLRVCLAAGPLSLADLYQALRADQRKFHHSLPVLQNTHSWIFFSFLFHCVYVLHSYQTLLRAKKKKGNSDENRCIPSTWFNTGGRALPLTLLRENSMYLYALHASTCHSCLRK